MVSSQDRRTQNSRTQEQVLRPTMSVPVLTMMHDHDYMNAIQKYFPNRIHKRTRQFHGKNRWGFMPELQIYIFSGNITGKYCCLWIYTAHKQAVIFTTFCEHFISMTWIVLKGVRKALYKCNQSLSFHFEEVIIFWNWCHGLFNYVRYFMEMHTYVVKRAIKLQRCNKNLQTVLHHNDPSLSLFTAGDRKTIYCYKQRGYSHKQKRD